VTAAAPMPRLKAPFPWFGGKSRAAELIWQAFGDVPNYVEPFAGSLAVLLARPHEPRIETVNDKDCYLANLWRSIKLDPEQTAVFADAPVNEADLHARHRWLVGQADFRERMLADPEYYDPKIAGWWLWGQCAWIGSGWCAAPAARQRGNGDPPIQLPHLGDAGRGIHRKLPHLGDAGMGSPRPLPHLGMGGDGSAGQAYGRGVHSNGLRGDIAEYFALLSARLRYTRVACGDWTRVLGDSVTWRHGTTAILLDPPYDDGEVAYAAGGSGISADVRAWAVEHGDDTRLRIVLCGYEGEHPMPSSWRCVVWKAHGGYGGQRRDGENENARRERLWLSPHCLNGTATAGPLFAAAGGSP
jgi:hypothetical protein